MPLLSVKTAEFVNKAQTKIRELATYLVTNFDDGDYQSPDSRHALLQIYEFRQFTRQLLTYNYGGLTPKQVNDFIDYFTAWGNLNKISTVNYTSYQSIIEENVTVPAGNYALSVDLTAEIAARQAGDAALDVRVTVLENNQLDPDSIFPPHFFDNQVASNINVWDDDPRLHTHSNKSILDQISSGLLSDLLNLAAHYASYGGSGSLHITAAERTNWNAKLDSSALAALSSVYAPISHVNPGSDKHTIDQITNLQAVIDALNDAIAAMAGQDGREVELQRSGDNLQWRYTGDLTWTDLGNIKGDQGIQGNPFTIGAKGLDADRFDSIYDSEDEQFGYLALDTGFLYFRNPTGGSATLGGGWESGLKFLGDNGWSPILGIYSIDADTAVFELIDWVGGSGDKPVLDPGVGPPTPIRWFIAAGGLTLYAASAVNIKGTRGPTGPGPIIGGSGNVAGRAAFDSAPTGFIYLRTDVSPNTIYIKDSDAAADWSAPWPWQGPVGPPSTFAGVWIDCGPYDASTNLYPATGGTGTSGAIKRGNTFEITVAGTLGAEDVPVGTTIRALVDTPGNTRANWRHHY